MWELSDGTRIQLGDGALVISGTSEFADQLRDRLEAMAVLPILVYVRPPPSLEVPLDPGNVEHVDSWVLETARLGGLRVVTRPAIQMRETGDSPFSTTDVIF
jgi:hypothetical protein